MNSKVLDIKEARECPAAELISSIKSLKSERKNDGKENASMHWGW